VAGAESSPEWLLFKNHLHVACFSGNYTLYFEVNNEASFYMKVKDELLPRSLRKKMSSSPGNL
jgi:hypothetical protein